MKNPPLLSICIPTYNRAAFIKVCLESIQLQGLAGLVEIVVSDNASQDSTLQVLEDFASKLPLRWVIQPENIGSDRNFDEVVRASAGEYCWLLGSDDVIEVGALSTLLQTLQAENPDILHFGYVQGDIELNRRFNAHPPASRPQVTLSGLATYFGSMPNVSLLFTFMSSFAFRRSIWTNCRERQKNWMGTFYVQALTMHASLVEGASLVSLDKCLVVARGDNPNEINTVPGKFIALDASTIFRFVEEIYGGDPRFWRAFGLPFRRSYPVKALIYTAANGGIRYLEERRDILVSLGYPKWVLNTLVLLNRLNLLMVVKRMVNVRSSIRKLYLRRQ